ncbi:protein SPA2, partial [Tremellales sp. Uapishka_1]
MSMTSSRPYNPSSPAPTTASSLNYSQYGSSSFVSPSRGPPSVSSSTGYPAARVTNTNASSSGMRPSAGLRPPNGGASGERRMESREVARIHWRALKGFLSSWLAKGYIIDDRARGSESPTSRASAREKLTRLTKLQFQELSTDVYDELMRRLGAENGTPEGDVPFLPVRDDFHPKRNQARQKLATLPKNRFKDLASDVFYELRRRYPEFEENEVQEVEESVYDEPPPAPGPVPIRPNFAQNASQSSIPYSQSQSLRDRSRQTPTPPPSFSRAPSHQRQTSRNQSGGSSVGAQPNPTAATNEVVVPNKSRMREEDIEVPYARESQSMETRRSSRASSRNSMRRDTERVSPVLTEDKEYYDRMSFSSNVTSKSKQANGGGPGWDEEREQKLRQEYEFRIAGLERKLGQAETERDEARRTQEIERERRKEWEDEVRGLKERATTHASSLRSLQHELDIARDAAETARNHAESSSRDAQEELNSWRDRCDGLEDELRRLEEEKASRDPDLNGNQSEVAAELKAEMHSLLDELNSLSIRNDELMAEREQDAQGMNEMEEKVEEYRKRWEKARIELRNLKATSTMFVSKPFSDDHLPASADGNIADLNVSAFQSAIDGLLAAARSSTPSGVLPAMKAIVEAITCIGEDVVAFEANPNIDVDANRLESLKHESTTRLGALMQAARNHAMASGLSPVSLLDAAAGHLSSNVVEIIKLLKIRRVGKGPREVVTRSRSSLSIKDMVNRNGQDIRSANGNWDREYGSGQEERLLQEPSFQPARAVRSPREWENPMPNFRINSFQSASSTGQRSDSFELERKASSASDRQNGSRPKVESQTGRNDRSSLTSATSASGSSALNPQTAPYEKTGFGGYQELEEEDEPRGGSESEWEELKPYLETQSSALVNSIQNLLAAIRTGLQTPALNEHLSEVIAIGSSIVAVAGNSLPMSLRAEGDGLLKDLVGNTNKLSEAQEAAKSGNGFEKNLRQQIASASFGVAKSLKALMKLGTE